MPIIITSDPFGSGAVNNGEALSNFVGEFDDAADLTTSIPVGENGDYALVDDPGTIWKWQGGAWIDTTQVNFTQPERDDLANLVQNAEVIQGHVNTFADLPDPALNTGLKYIVDNATGSFLTFNYKNAGTYLSTGTIWTSKFNAVDVINVLTSTQTQKALSANMGRVVNEDLQAHKNDTANPHVTTFTQVSDADPGTDITAAEAEQLTDDSFADDLHKHFEIGDTNQLTFVRALAGNVIQFITNSVVRATFDAVGNLLLAAYQQAVRDDGTVANEKVLTTNASGAVLLRKVLPFLAMVTDRVGGINQLTTYTAYLTLNFTIDEAGDYPIDWSYIWSLNDTGDDFLAQVVLDTVPPSAAVILSQHQQEPKDAGGAGVLLPDLNGGAPINSGTNQRHLAAGFSVETLAADDYSLTIQIAATDTNLEAAVYQGSLRVGHRANV